MKIFFLASGSSIHSFRWVKYFSENFNEITWISIDPFSLGKRLDKVKYLEIAKPSIKIFRIIKAVLITRNLIKLSKPDIIHSHYIGSYGLIGALVGFHPFVTTTWGSDVLINTRNLLFKKIIKHFLKISDLITCDAEHMFQAISKMEINEEKIAVINFGTDIKYFTKDNKDPELVKKLNIGNKLVIISLRSLEPIYRIDTLIRAIPKIIQERNDVVFIIVGKGASEQKLKNLSKKLKVEHSIRFIGGIENSEVKAFLNLSSIYVSTSSSDAGLSACTAEAMSCELPVIVTDSGENNKWIQDGIDGFLVPVGSSEILAEKITQLVKNKSLRKQFSSRGREIIAKKNNYYVEMQKMAELYNEVATKTNIV